MDFHDTTNVQQRSEEVADIVSKMPRSFAYICTTIVIVILTTMLLIGYTVDYSDVVTGTVTINSVYSPIHLVANSSGRLMQLNINSKQVVKEGSYLAIIQNSANVDDVIVIKNLLVKENLNLSNVVRLYKKFPSKVSLADINPKYYSFLNALQKLYEYRVENLSEKQILGLRKDLANLMALRDNLYRMRSTKTSNMEISKKIASRDSILLSEKVATEAELDNSKSNYLSSKENLQSIDNDINTTNTKIDEDHNKVSQYNIQKNDQYHQLQLDFLNASNELKDNINSWEIKYVLKAPISGTVELLKFLQPNQYVQSGEEILTIIPFLKTVVGQVRLPLVGAGKVAPGQNVNIKLANYPYTQYGSIKGLVKSISLTSSPVKTSNQDVDAYLVTVVLPHNLRTNYGNTIQIQNELKGSADIICGKRRLIQRFFDNLKTSVTK